MARSTILWTLAAALGVAAIYGAAELREQQDAERLMREARHVLSAPLTRAPDLARLEASRAVMLLDEALSLHDSAEVRSLRQLAYAVSYHQKGKPAQALEALERAGEAGELAGLSTLLPAELALDAGDAERALALLDAGFDADAEPARARVLRADVALARGRVAEAGQLLDALLAEHPDVGPLHNRRGITLEAAGDVDAAQKHFARAERLDASDPAPPVNLGRLSRARGEHEAAEQAFDRALRLTVAMPEAWLGRGLSRLAQGDLVGARLDLERARKLAPAEPAPLLALADVEVASGEVDEAVVLYRAAVALEDDAVAWLKLGNALVRAGELGQARQALEQSLSLDAELAAAHNGLGAVLTALGESDAAEIALKRAAALDESDPNPLLNLARLRRLGGDAEGAALALREAQRRAPHLALAH